MITHCNESSMIDRQSNKELKPICEKMLCFLQGLLRRGGPQVPQNLARRNARKRLNNQINKVLKALAGFGSLLGGKLISFILFAAYYFS